MHDLISKADCLVSARHQNKAVTTRTNWFEDSDLSCLETAATFVRNAEPRCESGGIGSILSEKYAACWSQWAWPSRICMARTTASHTSWEARSCSSSQKNERAPRLENKS